MIAKLLNFLFLTKIGAFVRALAAVLVHIWVWALVVHLGYWPESPSLSIALMLTMVVFLVANFALVLHRAYEAFDDV